MLDKLLNLLTTHALGDMQPGGDKKTYTSKNIGKWYFDHCTNRPENGSSSRTFSSMVIPSPL